jgi:hypothetical protein
MRSIGLILFCGLLIAGCSAPRGQRPASTASKNRNVPAQELAKPLKQFWFEHNFEPRPGRRVWIRADDRTWIEQYPDGFRARYQIKERIRLFNLMGEVVQIASGSAEQNVNARDGAVEIFIPDKGSHQMVLFHREFAQGAWQTWRPMASLIAVE